MSKGGEILLPLLKPTFLATYHEHKSYKEMILLTPLQEYQTEALSHPLATQLLQTLFHVFSKELPSGLPP